MNCRHYQRLLHLNRTGEILKKEAEDLRRHLRLCEPCSIEYKRIQRADEFLDKVGSHHFVSKNPEELTTTIVRRIREEASLPQQTGLLSRILDLFLLPAVRTAAVVCILAVVSTFMVQLLTTLDDIAGLEQQMASVTDNKAAAPEPLYTVESETFQNAAKSPDVKTLIGTMSLSMSDGHIEVAGKDAESILSLYNLGRASASVGSSALHIDRKTLDRIINEVKATAELTFRTGRQGA